MNSEISRIRRERWLRMQGNKKEDNGGDDDETMDKSEDKRDIERRAVNNDGGDGTTMKKATAAGASELSSQSRQGTCAAKSAKNGGKKPDVAAIDLTETSDDSDDEVVHIVREPEQKKGTVGNKRKIPENSSSSPSSSSASGYASTVVASSSASSSSSWEENIAIPKQQKPMKPFSVLSYNIWFGQGEGESTHHPAERMARISELISELKPSRPTFIGLQEVTGELLEELEPLLQSMGYRIICQQGVAYGCALGILTDQQTSQSPYSVKVIRSGFLPYQGSRMGRGLLWCHAAMTMSNDGYGPRMSQPQPGNRRDMDEVEVLFSTTHLESFMRDDNGSMERARQIREANQFCKNMVTRRDKIKFALITGDLNWDDERKRGSGTDQNLLGVIHGGGGGGGGVNGSSKWLDAWLETRCGEEGYSYDSRENPMLKGNLRRRFDRCLSYCPSGIVAPHLTDLIGKEAIEGLHWRKEVQQWRNGQPTGATSYDRRPLCPSDHFGLSVVYGDPSEIPSSATSADVKGNKKTKRRKKS